RRDNIWKARIKILVKAEGQRYIDQVEAEYRGILEVDGARHTITQEEFDRVAANFVPPATAREAGADAQVRAIVRAGAEADPEYQRWLQRNVQPHRDPQLRAV